jgi:hypothetical protein
MRHRGRSGRWSKSGRVQQASKLRSNCGECNWRSSQGRPKLCQTTGCGAERTVRLVGGVLPERRRRDPLHPGDAWTDVAQAPLVHRRGGHAEALITWYYLAQRPLLCPARFFARLARSIRNGSAHRSRCTCWMAESQEQTLASRCPCYQVVPTYPMHVKHGGQRVCARAYQDGA